MTNPAEVLRDARHFFWHAAWLAFRRSDKIAETAAAFMTTPPTSAASDDTDTLYWLTMARRILSGDIAPQDARHLLDTARTAAASTAPDAAATLDQV